MMSRWCDQSIPTRDIPHFPVALYEVAVLFGTVVAKTILASVHVRAHKQAGHMDASDLIKTLQYTLQGGGRPHMRKIVGTQGGGVPSDLSFRRLSRSGRRLSPRSLFGCGVSLWSPLSADAVRTRSRCSSSIRARIVPKSSAARGWVTLPPCQRSRPGRLCPGETPLTQLRDPLPNETSRTEGLRPARRNGLV